MKTLIIIGRRWFQRTYGNTYHTVEIIVDGVSIHRSLITYGYSEMYLQTATQFLQNEGLLPGKKCQDVWPLGSYCRKHNIEFTTTCSDVSRQKDLRF